MCRKGHVWGMHLGLSMCTWCSGVSRTWVCVACKVGVEMVRPCTDQHVLLWAEGQLRA